MLNRTVMTAGLLLFPSPVPQPLLSRGCVLQRVHLTSSGCLRRLRTSVSGFPYRKMGNKKKPSSPKGQKLYFCGTTQIGNKLPTLPAHHHAHLVDNGWGSRWRLLPTLVSSHPLRPIRYSPVCRIRTTRSSLRYHPILTLPDHRFGKYSFHVLYGNVCYLSIAFFRDFVAALPSVIWKSKFYPCGYRMWNLLFQIQKWKLVFQKSKIF